MMGEKTLLDEAGLGEIRKVSDSQVDGATPEGVHKLFGRHGDRIDPRVWYQRPQVLEYFWQEHEFPDIRHGKSERPLVELRIEHFPSAQSILQVRQRGSCCSHQHMGTGCWCDA